MIGKMVWIEILLPVNSIAVTHNVNKYRLYECGHLLVETLTSQTWTLGPKPETADLKPETLHPKPETLDPNKKLEITNI